MYLTFAQGYQGSRYSYGYPACPDLEGNGPILDLLRGVEGCETAFLSGANAWLAEWPGDQSLARPRAIRIRLALAGYGRFERVFPLP